MSPCPSVHSTFLTDMQMRFGCEMSQLRNATVAKCLGALFSGCIMYNFSQDVKLVGKFGEIRMKKMVHLSLLVTIDTFIQ